MDPINKCRHWCIEVSITWEEKKKENPGEIFKEMGNNKKPCKKKKPKKPQTPGCSWQWEWRMQRPCTRGTLRMSRGWRGVGLSVLTLVLTLYKGPRGSITLGCARFRKKAFGVGAWWVQESVVWNEIKGAVRDHKMKSWKQTATERKIPASLF